MTNQLTQLLNVWRTPNVLLSWMIILAPINIFDCEATGLPGKSFELVRGLRSECFQVFEARFPVVIHEDECHWT